MAFFTQCCDNVVSSDKEKVRLVCGKVYKDILQSQWAAQRAMFYTSEIHSCMISRWTACYALWQHSPSCLNSISLNWFLWGSIWYIHIMFEKIEIPLYNSSIVTLRSRAIIEALWVTWPFPQIMSTHMTEIIQNILVTLLYE